MKEVSDLPHNSDQAAVESKPLTESFGKDKDTYGDEAAVESNILIESSAKTENIPITNGELSQKEDLTSNENQKSSRKASIPVKQERAENALQSSPTLPSYMAATESAKAKLRGQGSPRLGQEVVEKKITSQGVILCPLQLIVRSVHSHQERRDRCILVAKGEIKAKDLLRLQEMEM